MMIFHELADVSIKVRDIDTQKDITNVSMFDQSFKIKLDLSLSLIDIKGYSSILKPGPVFT